MEFLQVPKQPHPKKSQRKLKFRNPAAKQVLSLQPAVPRSQTRAGGAAESTETMSHYARVDRAMARAISISTP
jgi:hypothetical protein